MEKVRVPCRVPIYKRKNGTVKWFSLNLNVYRNTHYTVLNKAKHAFNLIVLPRLRSFKPKNDITIRYKLFLASNKRLDANNFYYIISKFFEDTLQEAGIIPDDNFHIIRKTIFDTAEVDTSLDYHECEIIID